MRPLILVLLFLGLFLGPLNTQEMIADITEPVETEFGTYYPNLVTISPNAPMCDPGMDLENVVNLSDYTFSDHELALLKQNHFVVVPARTEPW